MDIHTRESTFRLSANPEPEGLATDYRALMSAPGRVSRRGSMPRKLVLALSVVACFASAPAHADITSAFGNTILSRYPDGGWVKHWFNPDGTYAAHFSDGRRLTGLNQCL